jgi:hypothetical protein
MTIARQRDRLPHDVREPEFEDILTKVTTVCLRHLKDQLQLAKSANYQPNCSGQWTAVYGLPCCHTLYRQLHRSATSVLKIQLAEIDVHWWFDRPLPDPPTGPPIDPLLLIQEPLTVECRRGRPPGSTNRRHIDTSTRREPSAFERNTTRGGSSQTASRGGSSQISPYTASQVTAQSNQSTQEHVGSITSGITGGKNGGGSQDASADGLPSVGGNISQAYSGRGALPFQQDFTEGSFGAFQL